MLTNLADAVANGVAVANPLKRFECGRPVGLYADQEHTIYVTLCHRLKYHFGPCRHRVAIPQVYSFYCISFDTWPGSSRLKALRKAIAIRRAYRDAT